ncbi:MAG TPA: kelch repeat-containing protein [Bacteroidia bacterium]|nr:kelch repeat-containing protein [Bacteroidia bacterium]
MDKDISVSCNTWNQDSNFPGPARYYVAGFSIGKYGYIGNGWNNSTRYKDFYKWNSTTNSWSAVANYPGNGTLSPISFSIEGKGYVGLGWGPSSGSTDLWSYDTTTNSWTAMANFPGQGRYDESVFVIGHKAYVIGGSTGGPPYLNDVWMYDAHTNTWTAKNTSPAGQTDAGPAFAIGNHGYIGGGDDGMGGSYSAFWRYDTTTDTWDTIASFPVANAPTGDSRAFVIGSKGYVCTGTINTSNTDPLPAGYVYDTVSKAWSFFSDLQVLGIGRGYAAAFTIGNCGYIGAGQDSAGGMRQDFWGYCPCQNTEGINNIHPNSIEISIYPNPSSGVLNIKYNILTSQDAEFRIIDMFGRQISSYYIDGQSDKMILNENSLEDGMYFYQVVGSGKLISFGKFIIAK